MEHRGSCKSHRSGLNRRPLDYESSALPLSYCGVTTMPWRGLEPRRLSAPPPQDGVSTNFTTRARGIARCAARTNLCPATRPSTAGVVHEEVPARAGLTGLEPATSGVTDRHSNQAELQPQIPSTHIAPTGVEPVSAP